MTENQMFKQINSYHYYYEDGIIIGLIKYKKIETGRKTIGIPDIYFYFIYNNPCDLNLTGWIELKIAKKHKNRTIEIPYRPGQLPFLKEHSKANKRTYCLVYFEDCYYLFNRFYRYYNNKDNFIFNSFSIFSEINKNFMKKIIDYNCMKDLEKGTKIDITC